MQDIKDICLEKIKKLWLNSIKHSILNKGHLIIKDEILIMPYKAKFVITYKFVDLFV